MALADEDCSPLRAFVPSCLRASSFSLTSLRDSIKPSRLHWFPTLGSTNDHAAVLRKRGDLFAPSIVLTGRQTAGRGRGQNAWWSGPGCLTVTFVLPVDERLAAHQVPLIAGLAVRNAAAELAGSDAIRLKWPNDLVVDSASLSSQDASSFSPVLGGEGRDEGLRAGGAGTANAVARAKAPHPASPPSTGERGKACASPGKPVVRHRLMSNPATLLKLAGLLCERIDKVDLIGVGLNVNVPADTAPPHLAGRVVSLADVAGTPLDMTGVVATIASHLRRTFARMTDQPFAGLLAEYDEHHALVGRKVSVVVSPAEPAVTGKCAGLDSMGRLLLRSGAKTHAVIAGHVSVID